MAWTRMRFRGERVWVRSDDAGRPVLDRDGRAEMKYRQGDPKSYRPGAANLTADPDAGPPEPEREARGPDAGAGRPAPARAGAAGRAGDDDDDAAAAAPDTIHVWTDGACSGNPGPMAIGVVVLTGDRRRELGEYLGVGTNNIAELVAIERGLELATEIAAGAPRPLRVYSDSGYAIGLLSKGWKAKANQDLVARLRKRVAALPAIAFVKVRGHAGVEENERCDELARSAIERATLPR